MPQESHVPVFNLLQMRIESLIYWWALEDNGLCRRLNAFVADLIMDDPQVQEWATREHINLSSWKCHLHCTACYHPEGNDTDYAEKVSSHLQQRYDLILESLWMGRQGMGMEVHLSREQQELW